MDELEGRANMPPTAARRPAPDQHETNPIVIPADLCKFLLQLSGGVVAVLDREGAFRSAATDTSELFGVNAADLDGASVLDLVHPDDCERVTAELKWRLRIPGEHRPLRYRIRHASGRWRHVESVSINRLEDANVGGIIVAFRDVTDEVREARLRAELASAISAHMTSRHPDVIVNRLCAAATHYLAAVHPDASVGAKVDASAVVADEVAAGAAGAAAKTIARPSRLLQVNGVQRLSTAEHAMLNRVAQVLKLTVAHAADRALAEDMTARRATAFHNAPIATAIVGLDGLFRQVNDSLLRLAETSRNALVGHPWTDLLHPDSPPVPDLPLRGTNTDAASVRTVTRWQVGPDGEDRWVLMSAAAVVDRNGQLRSHLVQYVDITDQHVLAEHLRDRLDTTDAEKARLSALVTALAENHEQQRAAIATHLTEDAVQTLVGTRYALDGLPVPDDDPAVARVHGLLDHVISALKQAATDMRPATLDLFGLEPTARQLLEDLTAAGLQVRADIEPLPRLSRRQETLAYRVLAAGASLATRRGVATVEARLLVEDRTVRVLIRDDGPVPDDDLSIDPTVETLARLAEARSGTFYAGPRRDPGPGFELACDLPTEPQDRDPSQ